MSDLSELVRGVRLLCLDAGNTVVFLDHEAIARQMASLGVFTDVLALRQAEGEVKHRLQGGTLAPSLKDADIPAGWSRFVRTMIETVAALSPEQSTRCVRALWAEHLRFNLWRVVPIGLVPALASLRAQGVPIAIVSNSEGRLLELFSQVGLSTAFDLVLDSHIVGVEKPDPEIFRMALRHFHVEPSHALHLGDIVATDVLGAHAAGIRVGLIDPWGHYTGEVPEVARVPDVVTVANALSLARGEQR